MFKKLSHLKTLIRADSSSILGHGHIRRDLVLAKHFDDVSFACIRLDGDIVSEIKYPVFELENSQVSCIISLIKKYDFKLLIIDHYGISLQDEKEIKEQTGVKILSFDDEYKEHFCDILLNVNLYANQQKYIALTPSFCQICCGKNFMLVRDEFYKEKNIKRDKIFDIFIGLGGSDASGLSIKIATTLLAQNKIVAMATTTANPLLNELINLKQNDKNFHLFINSHDMAMLMNQSLKLIISASSFVNEALVLGANFKAIKTANNQDEMYKWLLKNGYETYDKDMICKSMNL